MSYLSFILFTFIIVGLIISGFLFVVFSDVTVRRLRNHQETKDVLGVEFATGADTVNVAVALSLPRPLYNKLFRRKNQYFTNADAEKISAFTSVVDRLIARLFFWSYFATVLTILTAVTLYSFKII